MWNLTGNNAVTKPGRSLLPVLIVLFLVSYGLLTMLVVEQGRTIDSQRSLIQMLFSDSVELTRLEGEGKSATAGRSRGAGPRPEEIAPGAGSAASSPGAVPVAQPAAGRRKESEHQQTCETASAETSESHV